MILKCHILITRTLLFLVEVKVHLKTVEVVWCKSRKHDRSWKVILTDLIVGMLMPHIVYNNSMYFGGSQRLSGEVKH